jgi:hypothetical protein
MFTCTVAAPSYPGFQLSDQLFSVSGLTVTSTLYTIRDMIETVSFALGLGFSLLVYFHSIRPLDQSRTKKAFIILFTFIGITGMLFLAGVLIAHFLRKMGFSV